LSPNTVPIVLVGNLTDAPELRFTPQGVAVCRFTIAVNRRIPDPANPGKFKDGPVSFFGCTAWRSLAENVAECLATGTRVVASGVIEQHSWKDKDDPSKTHYRFDTTVNAIGPDLTWATAEVSKAASRNRDQLPPDDPWATGSREPAMAGVGADEPPF
jgi:single-strand DNA-binding protein